MNSAPLGGWRAAADAQRLAVVVEGGGRGRRRATSSMFISTASKLEGRQPIAPRRQRQRGRARQALAGQVEIQLQADVDDPDRAISESWCVCPAGRMVVAWAWARHVKRRFRGARQPDDAWRGRADVVKSSGHMNGREPVQRRHFIAGDARRGLRRGRRLPGLSPPLPRDQADARVCAGEPRRAVGTRVEFRAQIVLPVRYVLDLVLRSRGAFGRLDLRRGRDRDRLRRRLALRGRGRRDARRLPGRAGHQRASARASSCARSPTVWSARRCRACSRRSSARSRKRQTASARLRDVGFPGTKKRSLRAAQAPA